MGVTWDAQVSVEFGVEIDLPPNLAFFVRRLFFHRLPDTQKIKARLSKQFSGRILDSMVETAVDTLDKEARKPMHSPDKEVFSDDEEELTGEVKSLSDKLRDITGSFYVTPEDYESNDLERETSFIKDAFVVFADRILGKGHDIDLVAEDRSMGEEDRAFFVTSKSMRVEHNEQYSENRRGVVNIPLCDEVTQLPIDDPTDKLNEDFKKILKALGAKEEEPYWFLLTSAWAG